MQHHTLILSASERDQRLRSVDAMFASASDVSLLAIELERDGSLTGKLLWDQELHRAASERSQRCCVVQIHRDRYLDVRTNPRT